MDGQLLQFCLWCGDNSIFCSKFSVAQDEMRITDGKERDYKEEAAAETKRTNESGTKHLFPFSAFYHYEEWHNTKIIFKMLIFTI